MIRDALDAAGVADQDRRVADSPALQPMVQRAGSC